MAKVMFDEKLLRKDTIDGLMQFHGIKKKKAKKLCDDSFMEQVMDAMFDAQNDVIVNAKVKSKSTKQAEEFVSKDADIA